jgi:hypothetical protein
MHLDTLKVKIHRQGLWLDGSNACYSYNLNNLLKLKDTLIVVKNSRPPFSIILGVPHQARVGAAKIAESWQNPAGGMGRDSDENAASYALVAYSTLSEYAVPCKLVIACHFTDHDPNKDIHSPYCQEIFSETGMLLLECHGAGERRKRDIEISSGLNKWIKAIDFGRLLAKSTDYQYRIAAQLQGGTNQAKTIHRAQEVDTKLSLPALKTTSLAYANELGMPALHIEAKPKFRIPNSDQCSVSSDGVKLGRSIAEVISTG